MKKVIRFAIAQMNPTVGDYAGNTEKILSWIDQAEARSADLLVFPENCLSGYPVWDLANKKRFVDQGLVCLEKIIRSTRGKKAAVALGFIDQNPNPKGRSLNALAWIQNGRLVTKYAKRLLPTYDVFLEDIFFEPGTRSQIVRWHGLNVGLTICEDIWDDRYETKPVSDLKKQGADMILNISASPYYHGVDQVREALVRKHAQKNHLPILYVNQVGGQDDLIFDGRSFFCDAKGRITFLAPIFSEGLFFYDWDIQGKSFAAGSLVQKREPAGEMYDALVLGIRDYCRKNKFEKVVIGLSGGIDSALVAALAVDALGPKAVTGVTMPGSYSSKGSWADSQELAKRLGIECLVHPIKQKYEFMLAEHRRQVKKEGRPAQAKGKINLAMENLQARLRGLELMFISNDQGRLVLTTGNKSELAMGYCTLYGDMAGGLCVLGDVYKTDVYRLARYRNKIKEVIPQAILKKAPSAELRPNQKDQDSLPAYEVLDEILYLYIEKNNSRDEITRLLAKKKIPANLICEVIRKVDHNEYKRRQTPPVLRVTEKSWFGRRMPITNRFEP